MPMVRVQALNQGRNHKTVYVTRKAQSINSVGYADTSQKHRIPFHSASYRQCLVD